MTRPPEAVNNYGFRNVTTYHTFSGTISHIRGNHSLRRGGEFRVLQENNYDWGSVAPRIEFGTLWTRGPLDNSPAAPIGQGLAAFLLGLPTTGYADRNASYAEQSKYAALFIQDDFKLTRNVTLNAGLRWELELPVTERYNRTNRGFDFVTPNPVEPVARAAYARNPVPQVPVEQFRVLGGLRFAGVGGQPRGLFDTDWNNFAPRVGLAWRLGQAWVVRAG